MLQAEAREQQAVVADVKYQPVLGARITRAQAEVIGPWLDRLSRKNGNKLTAEIVLSAAKPAGSPVHGFFDWSDKEAANEWRLEQARRLIRSVRIVITSEDRPDIEIRPVFVHLGVGDESVYVPAIKAMNDAEMRAQVIAQAKRELIEWEERYRRFVELRDICQMIRGWNV